MLSKPEMSHLDVLTKQPSLLQNLCLAYCAEIRLTFTFTFYEAKEEYIWAKHLKILVSEKRFTSMPGILLVEINNHCKQMCT